MSRSRVVLNVDLITTRSILKTIWMASGGIKGGKTIGATDEIGLRATEYPVHVHHLHATILGLMGLDHTPDTPISRPPVPADRRSRRYGVNRKLRG